MNKLQITLTDQEKALLAGYGSKLGYNVSKTAKFILRQAVAKLLEEGTVPVYQMSWENEKKGIEALEEHKAGSTIRVDDAKKFFEEL